MVLKELAAFHATGLHFINAYPGGREALATEYPDFFTENIYQAKRQAKRWSPNLLKWQPTGLDPVFWSQRNMVLKNFPPRWQLIRKQSSQLWTKFQKASGERVLLHMEMLGTTTSCSGKLYTAKWRLITFFKHSQGKFHKYLVLHWFPSVILI